MVMLLSLPTATPEAGSVTVQPSKLYPVAGVSLSATSSWTHAEAGAAAAVPCPDLVTVTSCGDVP